MGAGNETPHMERIRKKIIQGIREYFEKHQFKHAVLGLSGGIDSTVTLKLAAEALGAGNITAVLMPETGLTNEVNMNHARKICEALEIPYYHIPINKFITDFNTLPWKQSHAAQINTKPRIRAMVLYNLANTLSALVLGTSNKSELMLGYVTKYGDSACDIEPIGDLFKSEVYELARHLGIPEEIIKKPPTAELYMNQTDEKELGAPYEDLDKILRKIEAEESETSCVEKGLPPNLVHRIFRMHSESKHKRKPPFVIKIAVI